MGEEFKVGKWHFKNFNFQVETRGNFSTVSATKQNRLEIELEFFGFTFWRDFLAKFESEFKVKILEHKVFPTDPNWSLLILINHQI